jgi:hypothetical protein
MELIKKEQKISKALEAIEDLYTLGDASLYPLFDRVFYQVGELSRLDNSTQDQRTPKLERVHELFQKHAERLVQMYFGSRPQACQVSFTSDLSNASMTRIDFICELLPQIFNCGAIFNFQKNLSIDLKTNEVSFKGKVSLTSDLDKLRMDCYRLSRTFLEHKVLFTFESLEADTDSQYDIKFKFSMLEESTRVFAVKLGPKKWISFPNLIGGFEIELSRLKTIGNHKIYTIDENYQLKASCLSDVEEFTMKERAIALHFPFLFRPISLIISGEGTMVEKSELFRLSSTGCDEDLKDQGLPSWQHIDLLELMKN